MDKSSVENLLIVLRKKKEMLFKRMQDLYDQSTKGKADHQYPSSFLAGGRTVSLLRSEFIACVDKINELSISIKEKFVPNYADVEAFELLFCEVNEAVHSIESHKVIASSSNSQQMRSREGNEYFSTKNKLPPINIPSFSGAPEEWPIFYQVFTKLVHENPGFSAIEKVTHLITHLEGSAKMSCVSIPPTAENYELILETLKSRFDDKRMLASIYFEKILNFKTLNLESSQALDNFLCNFVEPVNALKQMDFSDLSDYLFLHLALKKLDNNTSRSYEGDHRSDKSVPTFQSLVTFVTEQAKILSRGNIKLTSTFKSQSNLKVSNKMSQNFNQHVLLAREPDTSRYPHPTTFDDNKNKPSSGCSLCAATQIHSMGHCAKFRQLKVDDRWEVAKAHRICFNCLSPLHMKNGCKSKSRCRVDGCNMSHHSMLHRVNSSIPMNTQCSGEQAGASTNCPVQTFCSTDTKQDVTEPSTVLLATVTVLAKDTEGTTHELRGLLDSGSQSNFITSKACRKLGLQTDRIQSVVKGIGSSPMNISACTLLHFRSRIDPTHNYVAHALVVEKLSDSVPSAEIPLSHFTHLKDLPLADIHFFKPGEIDLLIGAELWPFIVGTKRIVGNAGTPVALETTLGYIIVGRTSLSTTYLVPESQCFLSQSSLDTVVRKFWALEEVPSRKLMSKEDVECEQFFLKTCVRNADGTFTVSLPFRKSPESLGSSRESSLAKFISLERRLLRNQNLRDLFSSVIQEYVQDGTITRIGYARDIPAGSSFYLPYHGIFRPEHPTTPLRIVFNASAPSSSLVSLNDILFVGPKLQADIFNILIHFRLFRFVLTADIKRMFLQIHVSTNDRRFQRFFWRGDPDQPIDVFEINRVVFGNTSSPYLANRVILFLAELEKSRFPLAATVTQRDVYVDDIATSAKEEPELIELHKQLDGLFSAGGFTLSKWASNSPNLLAQIPDEARMRPLIDFDQDSSAKVLGVSWSPVRDCFTCVIDEVELPCTKRNVLSITARIFDPLGLFAPVTLLAKLMIKELWNKNIDWDEPPPPKIVKEWNELKGSLPLLRHIFIERHTGIIHGAHTSLIGFADSSTKAYGACIYICSKVIGTSPISHLLCAKSKIAPSTVVTIPRLELCAALLLARLMRHVIASFESRHTFDAIVAFSDSKVALHWIRSDASRWKIFIGNRIAQIQEHISAEHWRHVPGKENPADILSRGLCPADLINNDLWFHGPSWLALDESEWPKQDEVEIVEIPETEAKLTSFVVTRTAPSILTPMLERISSFNKLLRATAYVFRICTRSNLKTPFISVEEIQRSTDFWIRNIQVSSYPEEIHALHEGRQVTSNIRRLDPFLHDGVLRVGGRLQNAPLPFEQRHPILLPTRGKFTDLIIDHYHHDLFHGGQQLVLSSIRQRYWIPSAVSRIRARIHQCNICFRTRPKPTFPKMAPLPGFRVEGGRVFERSGVDYAGPFLITPHRRRGQPMLTKSYVCLFICLAVKAVHIELASDLSTECFMAAYKRFISRRGPCSLLLSDGGSNFIGAKKVISDLDELMQSDEFQKRVGSELTKVGTNWKINPASGPWFGGIWESNIKTIKGHLQRVIGNQILTYEEFNTALIQIEAIMNSRPLCQLNNDPNSLSALTPAHFLTVGTSLNNLPAQDLQNLRSNRLSRYQLVDRLVQDYWSRWRREYLTTLQSRAKWTKETPTIKIGTVVILIKENTPPLRWPLGLVEKVYPGQDGAVRVVSVRTASGTYCRPVGKLCPLPTQ